MAECPGGRITRGTRSQFRLGMVGLGQNAGFYPVHLGGIMDVEELSQTGVQSLRDLGSPSRGTVTLTIREYEQTIRELKKENFDLKLRLFMVDEAVKSRKDKDGHSPTDNPVEVIVQINSDFESLQNELCYKDKLLQDALERAEKCEINYGDLEKKYAELQAEISSLSERPTKEAYSSLAFEKENLLKHIKSLEETLTEKEEEIDGVNQKIEILANQNGLLEEKIKKKSIAIRSFVYKNYKDKEMLPDELRNLVISALEAAKNRNKDGLAIAVKSINAALIEMMSSVQALNKTEEKENIENPQYQCLKKEFFEKSSSFLSNQNDSYTELSHIQSLKEVLVERNTPGTTHSNSLDSSVHESFVKGKMLKESAVNTAERDIIDYINVPAEGTESVQAGNLISFSSRHSDQLFSVGEHNLVNIETLPMPSVSSEESCNLVDVLEENKRLKLELKNKLTIIQDLRTSCEELKKVHLKETVDNALNASKQCSVYAQTDVTGHNLFNEYERAKLEKDGKLSDSVEELREDVLRLLLAIEDKNNELTNVKQSLLAVQEDLQKALNTTNMIDKDYYKNERTELHEKLAFSCFVNEELLKHLKNLKTFMEELLQNKFDGSIDSLSEKSDFFSNISRCLNESLKLSHMLSDDLSNCERSELFEECESLYKNGSYCEKNLPLLDLSQLNVPEPHSSLHQSSVSRRLFPKETIKNQDFTSEKFYSLLADKYSKLKSLLDEQGNVKDGKLSAEAWGRLNAVLASLSEALQKLHIAKENSKSFSSAVCGKCVMLDLFADLKASHRGSDFNVKDSTTEQEIQQQFLEIINLLKEACKDSFFLFSEIIDKRSQTTQSDILSGNENFKIKELEGVIVDLNNINEELSKNLDDVNNFLNAEKEVSESFKLENDKLLSQIHDLKKQLLNMKQREKESLRNQELVKEISSVNQNNSELNTLKDLEEKGKESSLALNQLTAELQKNKSDLLDMSKELESANKLIANLQEKCSSYEVKLSDINHLKEDLLGMKQKENKLSCRNEELMEELSNVNKINFELNHTLKELEEKWNECSLALDQLNAELQKSKSDMSKKCLEYENELHQQISKNDEWEDKFKNLECTSLAEKGKYASLIEDLKAEKSHYLKELESVREKNIALEHKNVLLSDNLKLKSNELVSLEETVKKLQQAKESLNTKYTELQTELENAKESVANLQEEKCSSYKDEVKLLSEINHLKKQLLGMEQKEKELSLRNVELTEKLTNADQNNSELNRILKELEEKRKESNVALDHLTAELQRNKSDLVDMQEKCLEYENKLHQQISKCTENEAKYCQQLKQLEAKSLSEKQRLINEISVLKNEREDIIQKLKNEKECYERLMKEKVELNQNYVDSCQQISSLKLLNEKLIQKKEFFEKALHSSNSECHILNQDLKQLRETLQNLESKCLVYEKELVTSAGMKDTLVEFIMKVTNELSSHRQKVNEICKTYGNENCAPQDEASDFFPVIDGDNVQKLCKNLSCESEKLLQSVDMLVKKLKNIHLKYLERKSSAEKHKKAESFRKDTEIHKDVTEHLKSQNDHLQRVIDEIQKSISEKEKSVQFSAYEIQSLKEKLQNSKTEIERGNQLLKRKDDEITMLQERIFNLQTYLNSIMEEKSNMLDKTTSFDDKYIEHTVDSASNNELPSAPHLKVSKMCQTNELEDPCHLDDTSSSASTLEGSKSTCCEKYRKKCHSLQTKLVLKKKHIEILEKEKTDLRESFLQQLQDKQDSLEKRDTVNRKLEELESVLGQKKAFISELKSELLKTCNSLIDKEKELDNLKEKLLEYENKSKDVISNMHDKHSILTNTVDTDIKTLRNYKWKLIQTIFDIQKKFYEKKGIHVNYFERFKDHVNNLYSMQLKQSFSKSESMPLLGSHTAKLQYDQNDKVMNLVGLELDLKCLENLKIFLNRFFVPCVLEASQTDVKSTEFEERKKCSSDRLTMPADGEGSKSQGVDVSFPNIFTSLEHENVSQENSVSFEDFASKVSHHLDCIENLFTAVRKCQWLEGFEPSTKEFTEVKSLLLKIFQEINLLHETSTIYKLFDLNLLLKNFDFVVAPSTPTILSRQDISDKESILSEETIAVSRTESPLSFEDVCPTKLPFPDILKLEEKTLTRESLGNRLGVVESDRTKTAIIRSSCDSICQRSHYSSPDLGIESDPNHDSSAPEQKEDCINKYQRRILEEQKPIVKIQKSAFTTTESAGRLSGHTFGETLYAIGNLSQFELLKKEVNESLVAIKSVLLRTGDGLHHLAKYTSPRKTLQYNTLDTIKFSCQQIEVCLTRANDLVRKFWTAPCPTEKEWKFLNDENQSLCDQLANLKAMIQRQESEFKIAMGKLEHAQVVKESMEKKISKKLVKTKKVIRQVELKLLENRCQNFPPMPKYPSDQTEKLPQANEVQQM